jgi:hypothetical protein
VALDACVELPSAAAVIDISPIKIAVRTIGALAQNSSGEWRSAARNCSEAENIWVIGASSLRAALLPAVIGALSVLERTQSGVTPPQPPQQSWEQTNIQIPLR